MPSASEPSIDSDRLQHALGIAYAFLNRRERTVGEVRERLEREGIEEDLIVQALATLVDEGYLDDVRFARLFVQDKRELEQWGRERIKRGLLARGVERELIDEALEATDTTEDAANESPETELDRALALLSRRFPTPPRERRERDRALSVLIRKGYEPELALDALAAYARGG